MRRKKSLMTILISMLLCAVMLAGCGNSGGGSGKSDADDEDEEITEESFVGTWGEEGDDQLVLNDDGEGSFTLWDEENDIEWEYRKKSQTVEFEYDDEVYTCKLNKAGTKLTVKNEEGNVNMKLEKQKSSKKKKKTKEEPDDEKDQADEENPKEQISSDGDDKSEKTETNELHTNSMKEAAGYYKITGMLQDGEDITEYLETMAQYGAFFYLMLSDEGYGYLDMLGEKQNLQWDKQYIWGSDDLKENGRAYLYEDNKLLFEEDGEVVMTCERLTDEEQDYYKKHGSELDEEKLNELYQAVGEQLQSNGR